MNDLRTRLTELAERGTPVGVEELRQRVMLDLAHERVRSPVPGWAIALAVAVAALVVLGSASLLLGGSDGSISPVGPADREPTTDSQPTTTLAVVERVAVGTVFPDGPIGYGAEPESDGFVTAETSNGVLWAWDEGGRIWRHTGDGWEALPTAPVPGVIEDVEYGGGSLWAIIDTDLRGRMLSRLEGDAWVGIDRTRVRHFAVDPTSGTVWISNDEELFRLDDTQPTPRSISVGAPEAVEEGFAYVGDIAVTNDGTVWAGGSYGYVPMNGSLAAYHDDTGVWEIVTPWKGEPIPAVHMAATSSGDLWVILSDWNVDPTTDESAAEWALAHRDGDTGEWTVHDTGLPDGFPFAFAADDRAVWLGQGWAITEGATPIDGLHRFDGSTWTHYLKGAEIRDVVVHPNGTVWYMIYGLAPLDQE